MKTLVNKILGIDKTRVLIGVPSNPQIKHFINTDLEKGSEKQEERLIIFLDALTQTGGGAITLKIVNDDNSCEVCGIMIKSNGEWFTVSKEEMQNSYTMVNPDGEPVTLPDNVRIVDFNMLCQEVKTIKDYEYEHLKCVAKRNADLYKFYPDEFESKMLSYGWKPSDIDLMKKHIERISGKPADNEN